MYSIGFDIFAKDRAGSVFSKLGDEVGKTETKTSKFKAAAISAAAVGGAALVGFGVKSVNTFKQVGTETLGLMKTLGGTAESASRLRFAATQSGVSFEAFQKSTGKLSKALGATIGNGKATAAMAQQLGFNFTDAHGKILPMNDLLPKLADRFEAMPAGAEKTSLAMKLFGKSGTDMLPFLNKGSAGIADLEKQSDKFGLTLSGKMLDSIKKSKASQREWNATLQGLQVQVGAQVLPIMNKFVSLIRSKVIPVIQAVTGFLTKHSSALKYLVGFVGGVVIALKAWSAAQVVLNAVLTANPVTVVVIALAALAVGLIYAYKHSATFRDIVQTAFGVIKVAASVMWATLKPIFLLWRAEFDLISTAAKDLWSVIQTSFKWIVDAVLNTFSSIVHGAANAFGWVPGLGGKLKSGAKAFDNFKNDVNAALSNTQHSFSLTANTMPAYNAINAVLRYAGLSKAYVQVSAVAQNGQSLHGRQGFASGTPWAPPGTHWVGEHGPELREFRGGERVHTANESARMAAHDGGGDQHVTIQLVLDGKVIQQSLLSLKRRKGGTQLGIA